MKKILILSIFISIFFAIQKSSAECIYNYPYNGQRVTYCIWNSSNDISYTNNYPNNYWYYDPIYNNWYNSNYYYSNNNSSYNSNNNVSNPYYYNNSSYNSNIDTNTQSTYESVNSSEADYYNIIYMNNLEPTYSSDVSSPQNKDYFEKNVIGNDVEIEMIDKIRLDTFSFNSATYNSKYADAKNYFASIKEDIKSKYLIWEISYNKIYDLKNDLEYLAFHLNYQFWYYKKYENWWDIYYKEAADESARTVRTMYQNLKNTLRN